MKHTLESLLGFEGYHRLRRLLRTYPLGGMDAGERGFPDDHIIVSQDADSIYVAADPCIWRFSKRDEIVTDADVLTVPLLFGLHDGKEWTTDQRQPSKKITDNPVMTVWNDALASAVHELRDTGIVGRVKHPYVRLYVRMYGLGDDALFVDDDFIWPFAASERSVTFKGSTPSSPVVAYVASIPVAVIMPCIPDGDATDRDDAEFWDRLRHAASVIHERQAVH